LLLNEGKNFNNLPLTERQGQPTEGNLRATERTPATKEGNPMTTGWISGDGKVGPSDGRKS